MPWITLVEFFGLLILAVLCSPVIIVALVIGVTLLGFAFELCAGLYAWVTEKDS